MIFQFLKNIFLSRWLIYFYFSKKDLNRISQCIAKSENKHRAEIRFAVEAKLSWKQSFTKLRARRRAIDVFSFLQIWDTEENNGVLVYLLLAEHKLEIIADRGIYKTLGKDYWENINTKSIEFFSKKEYLNGVLFAIEKITEEMKKLFPKEGEDPNELSNEVVIL